MPVKKIGKKQQNIKIDQSVSKKQIYFKIEMLIDISYDKPDYVADLYSTLASYLEKMSNSAE